MQVLIRWGCEDGDIPVIFREGVDVSRVFKTFLETPGLELETTGVDRETTGDVSDILGRIFETEGSVFL